MMHAPRVTFAGACNRPSFFPWHLGSILDHNTTTVEFTYVGHVDLPSDLRGRWPRFRYFKAAPDITPAQCTAWAFAQAQGDLLCRGIDDVEWDPGLLDQLVAAYDAEGDYRLMPSPLYFVDEGGREQDWTPYLRLINAVPRHDLPLFPIDGLISRRFFEELGGFDRRFFAVMDVVDVLQRAVMSGGRTIFPGGAQHERRTQYPAGYVSICDRHFFQRDRPLLESLWFPNGPASYPIGGGPRVVPLEPYTSEDLDRIGARMEEQS